MAKEWAKKFYRSKLWKNQREYILKRDKFLCQKCKVAPAEEVHHIIHLTPENINNPTIALGEKNLISLCKDCHFNIHREDRGIADVEECYEFNEDGYIIPIPPS